MVRCRRRHFALLTVAVVSGLVDAVQVPACLNLWWWWVRVRCGEPDGWHGWGCGTTIRTVSIFTIFL